MLTSAAAELNAVSDELANPICEIDSALQKLNLGVSVWVPFDSRRDDENEYSWECALGYGKVSREWGLAIRTVAGYDYDSPSLEEWQFADAPRSYRLRSIDKIPELLEKLTEAARKTTGELKRKVALAEQVATSVSQLASSNPGPRE